MEFNNDEKVLIDFYAKWCGPCKMMMPLVSELTNIKVIKVDVDEQSELARQYNVFSIPHFVIVKNGEVIKSHTGLMNMEQLKEFVDSE